MILGEGTNDVGGLITQVFAGLAVLMGAGATILSSRRNQDADELSRLRKENKDLKSDMVTVKQYLYQVQLDLAEQGITMKPMPHLKSEDNEQRFVRHSGRGRNDSD